MTQSVSFNQAAEYYDETRGFPVGHDQEAIRLFVQSGALTRASRVLEIGVGTGRIALPLSAQVSTYHGIDLSRAMLQRLHSKQDGDRLPIIEGDATQLPYADKSFDAVIAVHVFHLLPYREALAEVARVLQPGGVLLHGWGQRVTETELQQVWDKAIGKTPDYQMRAPFPRGADARFLEEVGWQPQGEALVYTYADTKSPQQFLDSLSRRQWSSLWTMPEDQLQAGLAELQAHVAATYPDPSQPLPMEQTFRVQAYLPPSVSRS